MWRLMIGLAFLLAGAGVGSAQERSPAYSTEQIIQILKPAGSPMGRSRGIRPGTGSEPPPGGAGSGVIPDLKLLFEFNSAVLTEEARRQLDLLGRALASDDLATLRFRVAGHTDAVGSDDYNRDLSRRRAEAVVRYLREAHGIAPARLTPLGLGKTQLADPQDPRSAVNRRVEISTVR